MVLTLEQITGWIGAFLWPFFRIAALFSVAPVFSALTVPVKTRLGLAIVVTLAVAPMLPPAPAVGPLSSDGILIVVHQILIGLAMGFALRLVFDALANGGQIIGMSMGLGFASMNDPQHGVSVPVLSHFFTLFATLLFLSLDGHLVLLGVLVNSFDTLPVSATGITLASLWDLVLWGGWLFSGAVLIALPATAAMLVVHIAFGVMSRASPQLNIFVIGFPITLLVGFVVIAISLPSLLPQLTALLDNAFGLARHIGGG
ncbi:MAG: flagellar biosynthetic protein FliR [Gammaproteobacteria bacterium]|nr:MAG: flagellar biosynthetic protein FliR [Gammaproteobacteria bacterium]TND06739.1 MAG: flagellar biosynthetic protein FliR [Gammaproteobacteria bacterium]